jgi:hypothetical protein
MIPDIEKFLPVAIFKMATTIPHKFNIVQFQRPDIEKFLPVAIFKMATKIQHCSISKVAFNLFFKPVVCGQFGRLHNRQIIIISCFWNRPNLNNCLLAVTFLYFLWETIFIK